MDIWTSHPTYFAAWTVVVHQGSIDDDCWEENDQVAKAYLEPLMEAGIRVTPRKYIGQLMSENLLKEFPEDKREAIREADRTNAARLVLKPPYHYIVMCKSHDEEALAKPVMEQFIQALRRGDPMMEWAVTPNGVVMWPVENKAPSNLEITGACGRSLKSAVKGLAKMFGLPPPETK